MDTVSELVAQHFNQANVTKIEIVQSLWSDYGEIARYYLPAQQLFVIAKIVQPPNKIRHPRGWNSVHSHQRKLRSYEVERHFYLHYAKDCDSDCRVAMCYTAGSFEKSIYLVLEDLDHSGFALRVTQPQMAQVTAVIRWLAYFHARFLGSEVDGLWDQGSYWHLATRPDEWSAMEDIALKQKAEQIDTTLRQARFQTLIHGDAKLANFCFSCKDEVAAVDFQYVGKGVGVIDLAYFLGSCFDQEGLFENADKLLSFYFEQLHKACKDYAVKTDFGELEAQWRYLYPYAWADFQRFLTGWSPQHAKLNRYMQQQTQQVLTAI